MHCRFEGCDRTDLIRSGPRAGYCNAHWQQLRYGRPLAPLRKVRPVGACCERDSLGRKLCILCNEWLEESEFGPNKVSRDRLSPRCALCASLSNHKLTKVQYHKMLEDQGYVCASCGEAPETSRYDIDHDHACCAGSRSCGKCVRGALCRPCNMTLGCARDSSARLRAGADYLDRWAEQGLVHP